MKHFLLKNSILKRGFFISMCLLGQIPGIAQETLSERQGDVDIDAFCKRSLERTSFSKKINDLSDTEIAEHQWFDDDNTISTDEMKSSDDLFLNEEPSENSSHIDPESIIPQMGLTRHFPQEKSSLENRPALDQISTESQLIPQEIEASKTGPEFIGNSSQVEPEDIIPQMGLQRHLPNAVPQEESGITNLPAFHQVCTESQLIPQEMEECRTEPEFIGNSSQVEAEDIVPLMGLQRHLPNISPQEESGIANLPAFHQVCTESQLIPQETKNCKTAPEMIGNPSSVKPKEVIPQMGLQNHLRNAPFHERSGIVNLPTLHQVITESQMISQPSLQKQKNQEGVGDSSQVVESAYPASAGSVKNIREAQGQENAGIANLPSFHQIKGEGRTIAEQSEPQERAIRFETTGLSSSKKRGLGNQETKVGARRSSRETAILGSGINHLVPEIIAQTDNPYGVSKEEIKDLEKVIPLENTVPQVTPTAPVTPTQPITVPSKAVVPITLPVPAKATPPEPFVSPLIQSTPQPAPASQPAPQPAPQPIQLIPQPTPVTSPIQSLNPPPAEPKIIVPVKPVEMQKNVLEENLPKTTPAEKADLAGKGYLINFNNVAIIEYIRFISKITGKNFIFDEAEMQFNVTIVSEEATTIDNIMAALLQELRIHGLSLIEQGNNLIIHTNAQVNSPGRIVPGDDTKPSSVETRVFTLTTLDPTKTAALVKPLLSVQSLIEPLQDTNNLVITDIAANIDKIAQLIKSLDSSTGGFEIGQYLVQNTAPESLIALAEKIMAPLTQGKSLVLVAHVPTNSIFIVAAPLLVNQTINVLHNLDIVEGKTRVLSLQSGSVGGEGPGGEGPGRRGPGEKGKTNGPGGPGGPGGPNGPDGTILFPGEEKVSPETLTRPPKWTSDLPLGHPQSTQFYIHKLQYRKGEQIESALQKIAESLQQTGVSNMDLIVTIRSIQWIESSNSLIFTGTRESLTKIKELIEEIDTPLRQVFIEVLILDTTIDDSLQYGVDWGARFGSPSTSGGEAFLSSTSPINGQLDNASLNGPVTLDPSGIARNLGTFSIGVIGRHITHGGLSFNSIGALVNALHTDTQSNIVLNPKIIVEDNVPAEIFVGINAPFKTQSIANDLGNVITNNFEYRDVGTSFKVTPFLGNNNVITLEIVEEVSSISPDQGGANSITGAASINFTALTITGIVTKKSRTATRIHVPDNYFVILSGMIQDENTRVRTQIPCLGGIPILGAAFSQKHNEDAKRNLMLFIRPHIIDKDEEYDEITKRQQDIFREKTRSKNAWKWEVDEALDLLNLIDTDLNNIDCP